MKKSKKPNIESFTAADAAIFLKNILTNPANLLWNVAGLYEEAAGEKRQELKDTAETLRGLYNEQERQKMPIIEFFTLPEKRIWQLSNIVSNPAILLYNVASLYQAAAKDQAGLKDTADRLAELAAELARGGTAL